MRDEESFVNTSENLVAEWFDGCDKRICKSNVRGGGCGLTEIFNILIVVQRLLSAITIASLPCSH